MINKTDSRVPTILRDAYLFAAKSHRGQKRKFTDEEYISHSESVACMLSKFTDDEEMIAAALLHDVIEDTQSTLEDITSTFGDRIASLVAELTSNRKKESTENKRLYLTKHFNTISSAALTIKLMDRLHNIMGMIDRVVPLSFVKWYFEETTFILNNLNREVNFEQERLLDMLDTTLFYIELSRKL